MFRLFNVPFIFIVFALLLPVTVAALFVCAVKLSRERRKASILYGISKDLETETMGYGGRMQASAQELRGIADRLAECSGLVRGWPSAAAWSAHCCGRVWIMLSSWLWRSGCRHFRRK